MNQNQEVVRSKSEVWPQILIMEDEPIVAKGLQMVLSEEGYGVDLAMTGRNALDTFHQRGFDLLIADLRLPDIDGMEVIRRVKHDRPDTGVIVITGYASVTSAVEAMKLGAHDYLPKPFTEDEVKSAVRDALKVQQKLYTGAQSQAAVAEEPVPHLVPPSPEKVRRDEVMAEMRKEFAGTPEELIPMLQRVQARLNYLPEDILEEIARFTKTPPASVYGVATFYKQFRLAPAGKHIVRVCRGTACHVKGAHRILNEIESRFHLGPGQTSKDGLLTLETVACFGSCAIAPVVVVDDTVKGRMNPSGTRTLLKNIQEKELGKGKRPQRKV